VGGGARLVLTLAPRPQFPLVEGDAAPALEAFRVPVQRTPEHRPAVTHPGSEEGRRRWRAWGVAAVQERAGDRSAGALRAGLSPVARWPRVPLARAACGRGAAAPPGGAELKIEHATETLFFCFWFFLRCWGLNSGPTPRATPPALFL
jgi:hypothetical protein